MGALISKATVCHTAKRGAKATKSSCRQRREDERKAHRNYASNHYLASQIARDLRTNEQPSAVRYRRLLALSKEDQASVYSTLHYADNEVLKLWPSRHEQVQFHQDQKNARLQREYAAKKARRDRDPPPYTEEEAREGPRKLREHLANKKEEMQMKQRAADLERAEKGRLLAWMKEVERGTEAAKEKRAYDWDQSRPHTQKEHVTPGRNVGQTHHTAWPIHSNPRPSARSLRRAKPMAPRKRVGIAAEAPQIPKLFFVGRPDSPWINEDAENVELQMPKPIRPVNYRRMERVAVEDFERVRAQAVS